MSCKPLARVFWVWTLEVLHSLLCILRTLIVGAVDVQDNTHPIAWSIER